MVSFNETSCHNLEHKNLSPQNQYHSFCYLNLQNEVILDSSYLRMKCLQEKCGPDLVIWGQNLVLMESMNEKCNLLYMFFTMQLLNVGAIWNATWGSTGNLISSWRFKLYTSIWLSGFVSYTEQHGDYFNYSESYYTSKLLVIYNSKELIFCQSRYLNQ